MERVKTGIAGLDVLLSGGIPKGKHILLTGKAGTGKTTIGSQFLYSGATQYGENGVYVSFEERPEDVKENMLEFGWDFDKIEKEGKISFAKYEPFNVRDITNSIELAIQTISAKRVVIDSIAGLSLNMPSVFDIRSKIFKLALRIKQLGCTTIFISEIPSHARAAISRFGVEEFITDGVIVLYYSKSGPLFTRAVSIWKMRGTNHDKKIHPYRITKNGIKVFPEEKSYEITI